ncbi:MAG: NUDIX domain-containing protein [Patescibacteria group bacterium]|mgnify:CR=1 FL=1
MRIEEDYIAHGKKYHVAYNDVDSFGHLPQEKITQHYGVCYLGNEIVICWHEKKKEWSLPGGKREPGEDIEGTLRREVEEETNMRVVSHKPIGYQEVFSEDGASIIQLRSFCIVEPLGEFVSDPAGHVTAIKCIHPSKFNEYIDWGTIGDRIIERAEETRKHL